MVGTNPILLGACTSSETTVVNTVQLPAFDLQGHRGARGLMPENTIPAMLEALELGVSTLEMDVHVTHDNKVILSHDPHINPDFTLAPNGKDIPDAGRTMYKLYVMDYEDIRKFDVGTKPYSKFPQQRNMGARIPLLSEVVDSVQARIKKDNLGQVFYNIEIKSKPETDKDRHPLPERFIQLVMQVVEEKGIADWVVIQSFDPRVLRILHEDFPQMKTSLLVENTDGLAANLDRIGFVPTIYSPNYELVDEALVKAVHERGMKIILLYSSLHRVYHL